MLDLVFDIFVEGFLEWAWRSLFGKSFDAINNKIKNKYLKVIAGMAFFLVSISIAIMSALAVIIVAAGILMKLKIIS